MPWSQQPYEQTPVAADLDFDNLPDGSAKQCAAITRDAPYARAAIVLYTGSTAPTNNSTFDIYVLRCVGSEWDDDGGEAAGSVTIQNAEKVASITVDTSTDAEYKKIVDFGSVTEKWAIAVLNSTGQAAGTDHYINVQHYNKKTET